jgi:hypothetical protein
MVRSWSPEEAETLKLSGWAAAASPEQEAYVRSMTVIGTKAQWQEDRIHLGLQLLGILYWKGYSWGVFSFRIGLFPPKWPQKAWEGWNISKCQSRARSLESEPAVLLCVTLGRPQHSYL